MRGYMESACKLETTVRIKIAQVTKAIYVGSNRKLKSHLCLAGKVIKFQLNVFDINHLLLFYMRDFHYLPFSIYIYSLFPLPAVSSNISLTFCFPFHHHYTLFPLPALSAFPIITKSLEILKPLNTGSDVKDAPMLCSIRTFLTSFI